MKEGNTRRETHQTERSEYWKSFDVSQTEFNEAEDNDDDVEAVPTVLEVRVETKSNDLQSRFCCEDRREDLQ